MAVIEMQPVSSSAFKAIGYAGGVLRVEFHSGHTRDHDGIPEAAFEAFRNAPSLGKHYHQVIRAFGQADPESR